LVAVTKAQNAESVRLAATAGVTDFGENYLKEALAKMDQLASLVCSGTSSAPSNPTRLAPSPSASMGAPAWIA